MKKVKRWRYYCDHCRKSGGSKYHIEVHESHCTNNPARKCGMCDQIGNITHSKTELLAALGKGDGEGMKRLRELTGNCPSCILAAIRQSGLMDPPDYDPEGGYPAYEPLEGDDTYLTFNFINEKARFWKDVNGDRRDEMAQMIGTVDWFY